jgi:transcriptional regulator with XRE-family HTH domain
MEELGRELRLAREAAGLTEVAVYTEAGWSKHKLWRIETGRTKCNVATVRYLAGEYGVAPELGDRLIDLAKNPQRTRFWEEFTGVLLAGGGCAGGYVGRF